MVMAENGKTKAELDREAGERAYRRFLELTGDTRTDMERQADVEKIIGYSVEEAAEEIAAIEKSGRTWFSMESSAGELVTYSKEDMISLIRRSIRR